MNDKNKVLWFVHFAFVSFPTVHLYFSHNIQVSEPYAPFRKLAEQLKSVSKIKICFNSFIFLFGGHQLFGWLFQTSQSISKKPFFQKKNGRLGTEGKRLQRSSLLCLLFRGCSHWEHPQPIILPPPRPVLCLHCYGTCHLPAHESSFVVISSCPVTPSSTRFPQCTDCFCTSEPPQPRLCYFISTRLNLDSSSAF